MTAPQPATPQRFAQKVKAGRGWLIVRNSGTMADTDYETVADEIVDALNKRVAYPRLVVALKEAKEALGNNWFYSDGEESYNNDDVINADNAITELLRELGEL